AKKSRDKEDAVGELIGYGVSLVSGLAAGMAISASIAPDLRCWRTIPSNFQAKRVYLEPGEYEISFQSPNPNYKVPPPQKIVIEPGKPVFVSFRTL
ncbi:MAG: hypothetical protein KDK36_11520, partial [Leptospiraceae bacterium]|nr:hypothetical protein [Leptospiraceae bacterium]